MTARMEAAETMAMKITMTTTMIMEAKTITVMMEGKDSGNKNNNDNNNDNNSDD